MPNILLNMKCLIVFCDYYGFIFNFFTLDLGINIAGLNNEFSKPTIKIWNSCYLKNL